MKFQTIFFLIATYTNAIFGKIGKIVGGENVEITLHPFMASLRYIRTNVVICGASIISNRHVLTAAHCVYKEERTFHLLRIYTGVTKTESTSGTSYKIENAVCHPDYTGSKSEEAINRNDIAVVKVTETIAFNRFQQPIPLPDTDTPEYSIGNILGWGSTTHPEDTSPEDLQIVELRIYPLDKCNDFYPFKIHPDQFCAFRDEGFGPCTGDSGGPFVHDGKVVGIVSFNLPCAQGVPDIYTRVHSYMDFIRRTISQ